MRINDNSTYYKHIMQLYLQEKLVELYDVIVLM